MVIQAWASAHRGKWGQLTPAGKMDEKLKSENMQKDKFSQYFDSSQGRHADVENSAMLTTYLFRYPS